MSVVNAALECLISLGWKGLPRTSALACEAHSYVTRKIKCCEYGPINWKNDGDKFY
jgi:hypothetical protein